MRRIIPLLLLAVLATNAAPQSGRRSVAKPPPPPPERLSEPPIVVSQPEAPLAAIVSGALPESVRTRQLQSLDNSSFSLGDFSSKVVVVNLWASWCGPCRAEIPEYEKVRKAYAGRDVEFIALTTEDPRTSADRVNRFVREVKFGFRLGWADRETARMLMNGRGAIPQTLVIAANGRIVSHWTGYSRGEGGDRLRKTIESALSEASSAAQKFQ